MEQLNLPFAKRSLFNAWLFNNAVVPLQTDRYAPLQNQLQNKFGEDTGEHITVKRINIPDLTIPLALGRQENFSLFIPWHRRMASALIEAFMSEFTSSANVNKNLFDNV